MVYSFWEKSFWNKKFDFIVVGAGFTGLNVAIELKEKYSQCTVMVIDKNVHISAASTKNAGFACYGSPSELLFDIDIMGADNAFELLELRLKGIENIADKYSRKDIDFRLCPAQEWFLESNAVLFEKTISDLDALNSLCKERVGKPLYRLSSESALNEKVLGAIDIFDEAQLNPMKLHDVLLKKAQSIDVEFLSGFTVDEISADGVTLKNDLFVKSKFVINCTNAFSSHLEKIQKVVPARAQVLITSEIEELPFNGNYHMDEGFYYFRNVGKRLLLGGARNIDIVGETTFDLGPNGKILNNLESVLTWLLPTDRFNYKIEQNWSGIMGVKSDKQPRIISDKNTFHLTGMSGMGVALSHSLPKTLVDSL